MPSRHTQGSVAASVWHMSSAAAAGIDRPAATVALVKVDPAALPQVLPAEAKKELASYGVDFAKVAFHQTTDKKERRLVITAPIQKPPPGTSGGAKMPSR